MGVLAPWPATNERPGMMLLDVVAVVRNQRLPRSAALTCHLQRIAHHLARQVSQEQTTAFPLDFCAASFSRRLSWSNGRMTTVAREMRGHCGIIGHLHKEWMDPCRMHSKTAALSLTPLNNKIPC